ncbi:MAG TPA: hypothetical protein VHV78_08140, partial [Gemmatimonadaceae bacterium]|nr:hypothetical protein [Gemmatimonadaceae bacterium]
MDDLRLATAYAITNWLHVGIGAHAIIGHNLVSVTQSFVDSAQFSAFTEQRILGFGGTALSGGFNIITKYVDAAASARWGGRLSLTAEDTSLSTARVPNRVGGSIAFTGLEGSTFAIRTSHDDWSSLGSLGAPGLAPVNAWDTSVGADIAGPRWGNRIVYFRGGFRMRTLPFLAAGDTVSEKSVSIGTGTTFASGHVLGDLAIIRAARSVGPDASERAWTVSIGLTVRP